MSTAVRAGRAFVEMYVESSSLYSGLKNVDERLRQWLHNIGLASTALGAGILGSLIPAINAASRKSESLNAFSEVFRGANEEADALAETLANRVGRSIEGIATAMTPIGAMVRGLGLAGDEAAEFAARATSAAMDISSFFNSSTEESFQRVRSALSGSSEAVDQFGINLRQQALQLKLTEMGFAGNVQAASELEKTLARLAIIEEALANNGAAGDLERTRAQYANLTRTLSDSFDRLLAAAGKAVLPIAEGLISALNGATQAAAQYIEKNEGLVKGLAALGATAFVAGSGLAALTSRLFHLTVELGFAAYGASVLFKGLNSLGAAFGIVNLGSRTFGVLGSALARVAQFILPFISRLRIVSALIRAAQIAAVVFTAKFWLIAAAVAAAGTALYGLQKSFGIFDPFITAIKAGWSAIQTKLIPSVQNLGRIVGEVFSALGEFLSGGIGAALGDLLTSIFGGGSKEATGLAGILKSVLVTAVDAVTAAVDMLGSSLEWLLQLAERFGLITNRDEKQRGKILDIDLRGKGKTKEEQADQIPAGATEEEAKQQEESLDQFTGQLKESLKTPVDIFDETMQQLTHAFMAGKLTIEEFEAGIQQAEQTRDDALRREHEASPAGQEEAALQAFGDDLTAATKTPLETFQEQMRKIEQAFMAGKVTGEVAQRGMEAAQKALEDANRQIEEEARRNAERERRNHLELETALFDRRTGIAQAIGGDEGQKAQLAAMEQHIGNLIAGGFEDEASEAYLEYASAIISRSTALDQRVSNQAKNSEMVTGSAREAMFGLGAYTVDEKLLQEQQAANKKADAALTKLREMKDGIDKVASALTD